MVSYKQQLKMFRRPDVLQKAAARWLAIAIKQKRLIFIALAALASVVIGLAGYNTTQSWRVDRLRADLAKIESDFEKELEAAEHQQQTRQGEISMIEARETALQTPEKLAADSADAKLSADERAKILKELAAKKTALDAELENFRADHSASLKQYEAFFGEAENYPEGWRAGMRVSEIYLQSRNYEGAAGILAKVLAKAGQHDLYRLQVRLTYVNVLDELGRYDDALQALEPLMRETEPEFLAKALLVKGRLLLAKGETGPAREIFDRIAKDFDKTAAAAKAKVVRLVWR
jgi:tetratricopeptide (TPR) repeat protein